jgi:ubiquinone/menaquinone biosynthesis C-methylase UbiE
MTEIPDSASAEAVGTRRDTELHGNVWDRFWSADRALSEVYGTDGRVVEALEQVGDWLGKTVLEVGCGSGRDGVEMALRGAQAVLLDLSLPALRTARQAAAGSGVRVALVKGDTLQLPFKTGSIDAVFHQGLLEHFRDPSRVLLENARVLMGGGVLLVDVPQALHPYTVLKKTALLLRLWFAGWETQFTPRRLKNLLEDSGLRVEQLYGRWFKPSLPYRILRQGLARTLGLRMPLYPRGIPGIRTLRARLAHRLHSTTLGLWTSANLGAIARKPPSPPEPTA